MILFPFQTCHAEDSPAGHCVWYGECNERNGLNQNCPYNGTAKPLLPEAAVSLLKKRCPHLVNQTGVTSTCCSFDQLKTLDRSIELAANFLNRCPSCMKNFMRIICDYTCSHDHSNYVEIVNITKNPTTGKCSH
ncbi:hypothetical protein HHI36_015154 [Cryptolaemus montrouzieri]|uniref:Niemann-Pick C1 N-terminal domain-containing protein n=1 Tax=Cryptolaemus montrouzieri TaxID=559131 RepID=A0ABD2N602_9CUCU